MPNNDRHTVVKRNRIYRPHSNAQELMNRRAQWQVLQKSITMKNYKMDGRTRSENDVTTFPFSSLLEALPGPIEVIQKRQQRRYPFFFQRSHRGVPVAKALTACNESVQKFL